MTINVTESANFMKSNASGLGFDDNQVKALKAEGISHIETLKELTAKSDFDEMAKSISKKPEGVNIGLIPRLQMLGISKALSFFDLVGREPTVALLHKDCIADFIKQWDSLQKRQKEEIEVPKIAKETGFLNWLNAFATFCSRNISGSNLPKAHLIRPEKRPDALPAVQDKRVCTSENGSAEKEMIAFGLYTTPEHAEDNKALFFDLEAGLRGSACASTLESHKEQLDGRGAHSSLVKQFAGVSKWKEAMKKAHQWIQGTKWKSTGNFPLEKYCSKHRTISRS